MSNGGKDTMPIATYYNERNKPQYVTQSTINGAVKAAAKDIGLYKSDIGYTPKDVSSHSLRAGGAMAMHLNGTPHDTIKKQGRWCSDTFLMYIHEQISGFATGLSTTMSQAIPFRNIAGPTLYDPSP